MDVYAAGEDPIPGVTGATVAAAVPLPRRRGRLRDRRSARSPPDWRNAPRPGDIVLTLGAGDVTMIGPEVLELLGRTSA